jgi:hypothetical protein
LATLLPHLSELQYGTKLFCVAALLHAEENKAKLALPACITSLQIGQTLHKEPCVISQLVRIASLKIGLQTLERVLARLSCTDEELSYLAYILAETEDIRSIFCGFVGEVAMGSDGFHNPKESSFALYKATGLWAKDFVYYLDTMENVLQAAQKPFPDIIPAFQEISSNLQKIPKAYLISSMLLPAMDVIVGKQADLIAYQRTALGAVGVARYRLKHQRLPEHLSEIVPDFLKSIPSDPYDGKALRYKKLTQGFAVYSLGEDRADNGGQRQNPQYMSDKKDVPFDIVFQIEK